MDAQTANSRVVVPIEGGKVGNGTGKGGREETILLKQKWQR
jgi:hypothetical protein